MLFNWFHYSSCYFHFLIKIDPVTTHSVSIESSLSKTMIWYVITTDILFVCVIRVNVVEWMDGKFWRLHERNVVLIWIFKKKRKKKQKQQQSYWKLSAKRNKKNNKHTIQFFFKKKKITRKSNLWTWFFFLILSFILLIFKNYFYTYYCFYLFYLIFFWSIQNNSGSHWCDGQTKQQSLHTFITYR